MLIESEFQNIKYSQSVEDLYPQLDKDNFDDNPESAVSYAKRSPLGHVVTNNQKSSITRETIDIFNLAFDKGIKITGVTGQNTTTASLTLEREHQLAGISTGTLNGGSGHTPGTYYNIKLLKDDTTQSSAVRKGATANVTALGPLIRTTPAPPFPPMPPGEAGPPGPPTTPPPPPPPVY